MINKIQEEQRIVGTSFLNAFCVEYWIEKELDDTLLEWQIQEENYEKSIPLLLFFLLPTTKRDTIKRLYLERYEQKRILPEWDCIPIFKELESFVKSESQYFQDNSGYSLQKLLDPDWRDIIKKDYCYCDFEMCPVTQVLSTP